MIEKIEQQTSRNIALQHLHLAVVRLNVDQEWKDNVLLTLGSMEVRSKPYARARWAGTSLRLFLGTTAFLFASLLYNHLLLPRELVRTRAALETQIGLNGQMKQVNTKLAELLDQQITTQQLQQKMAPKAAPKKPKTAAASDTTPTSMGGESK